MLTNKQSSSLRLRPSVVRYLEEGVLQLEPQDNPFMEIGLPDAAPALRAWVAATDPAERAAAMARLPYYWRSYFC